MNSGRSRTRTRIACREARSKTRTSNRSCSSEGHDESIARVVPADADVRPEPRAAELDRRSRRRQGAGQVERRGRIGKAVGRVEDDAGFDRESGALRIVVVGIEALAGIRRGVDQDAGPAEREERLRWPRRSDGDAGAGIAIDEPVIPDQGGLAGILDPVRVVVAEVLGVGRGEGAMDRRVRPVAQSPRRRDVGRRQRNRCRGIGRLEAGEDQQPGQHDEQRDHQQRARARAGEAAARAPGQRTDRPIRAIGERSRPGYQPIEHPLPSRGAGYQRVPAAKAAALDPG